MKKYDEYEIIARKYGLIILDKDVIDKEVKKEIDFKEAFKNLENKSKFSVLNYVDNYIYKNIKEIYKENYFFQYSIYLLSNYIFKDKPEFIYYLQMLYNALKELDIIKVDDVFEMLKNNPLDKLSVDEKKKQDEFASLVDDFFNDKRVVKFLEEKFNSKEIEESLLTDNYSYGQEYEDIFLTSLILLKGNVDIDEILNHAKSVNDIVEYILNKLLLSLCIKREDKKDKEKFLNYIYDCSIKDGYFFHGTTSSELESVKNIGLNPQGFYLDCKTITKINDIFEKHNMYKNFEGKMNEMSMFNFYITDSVAHAIYYANQSPEYLSRFCANGHHMRLYRDVYDVDAFWRRDFNECKNNIIKLCKKNNFTDLDLEIVLKNFEKLWNSVVKKGQYPIVFLGKRRLIGRDNTIKYDIIKDNIDKYSYKDILLKLTKPDNIHDKRLAKIGACNLSFFRLPNVYEFYKIKSNNIGKKYVMYNDNKVYPDIVINVPFSKIIAIKLDNVDTIIFKDKLAIIPNDISKLEYIKDEEFYTQDIGVLIAESGSHLTDEGKVFINKLRDIYSVNKVLDIYYNKIVDMLKNDNLQDISKLLIFVENYFIRFASMKEYNNYYVDISSDKINTIHYKVDTGNMLHKYTKTALIDDDTVRQIIKLTKEYILDL